ncbi:hypothetical protein KAI52_03425 [Candidatus Parcubacteria bacterium]|nr:hypothetical protein [Candidatus Parcubacteria bacterium]
MPRKARKISKEYLAKFLKEMSAILDIIIKDMKRAFSKEQLERFERHEKVREKLLAKKIKK